MPKTNAQGITTLYLSEGQEVPTDLPEGIKLVGPGAPITEEQYSDAMSRHGTEDFTEEDKRVQTKWLEQQVVSEPEEISEAGEEVSESSTEPSTESEEEVSTPESTPWS